MLTQLRPEPVLVEPTRVTQLGDVQRRRRRKRHLATDIRDDRRHRNRRVAHGIRDGHLLRSHLRPEPHHELARERPRLRRDVPHARRIDHHPALLQHLTSHGLLQRLALVHESREARVKPPGPLAVPPEQRVVAARAQGEHRGHQGRVVGRAACRVGALRLVPGLDDLHGAPALLAKLCVSAPPEKRRGRGD